MYGSNRTITCGRINGTPDRLMQSWDQTDGYTIYDSGVNRLPQVADKFVTFVGDLSNDKWSSVVDATLNSGNPCVDSNVAAATADSQHSGTMVGSGDGAGAGSQGGGCASSGPAIADFAADFR